MPLPPRPPPPCRLMGAKPAGVKLHAELTLALGTAATKWADLLAALFAGAWPMLGHVCLVAALVSSTALGR